MIINLNGRSVPNVIVGAGIYGLCTAYYLVSAGEEVLLLDRKPIGLEASGVNAGNLGIQNKEVKFTEVCMNSMQLWRELIAEFDDDVEYRQIGGMALAESEQQVEKLTLKVEALKAMGLKVELMSGSDARKQAPCLSSTVIAGSFCADDAHTNPMLTMRGLKKLVVKNNVEIMTDTEVNGLRQNEDGWIVLKTSKGEISTRKLVLATGAWISELAGLLGVVIPTWVKPLQGIVTERTKPFIPHLMTHIGGKLSVKQMCAGSVVIGGGWIGASDLQTNVKKPLYDSMVGNLRIACNVIPKLSEMNLLRCWVGHDARMPDELPLIGESPDVPGLFLVGCSPAGLGFGPLFGKTMAELMKGLPMPDWAKPFSVGRLSMAHPSKMDQEKSVISG